jgi:extracellular sulfatase Sulf
VGGTNGTHHWLIEYQPPLTPALVNFSDELYARRIRSLFSVDDLVAEVFDVLTATGQLDNTYVFYTSDHGYNLGQFRLPSGKFHYFENDIHVPLLVRGPGVTPGSQTADIVCNVDFSTTILDLAGVAPLPAGTDGTSFKPSLTGAPRTSAAPPRDRLLIEYWVRRPGLASRRKSEIQGFAGRRR